MAIYQLPKSLHPDFATASVKPSHRSVVDTSNPLSKNLVGMYLMNNPSYDLINIVNNDTARISNPGGSAGKIATKQGIVTYVSSQSNDSWIANNPVVVNSDDGFSILLKIRHEGINTFTYGLLSEPAGNNVQSRYNNFIGAAYHNRWSVTSPLKITDNEWHTIAVSQSFSNRFRFMLDGSFDEPVQAYKSGETMRFEWFNRDHTSDRSLVGNIEYIMIFNRTKTDAELQSLRNNPYQILKPKTPAFYFTTEAASGVTGTASHQSDTATHSATGERVITGSASHSATTATHSASGVVSGQITGTASHQASNATNSAIGERVVSGSGSHSANTATHVAIGDRSVTGTATHQANEATHIAVGTRTITGNSDHQAQTSTGSAIAERVISGSSAHQASTATHSANGTVGGVIAGSANHQASTSTHSATGERVISGASSHQANTSTHTATAERIATGASTHAANTATQSASGSVGNVVSGTANHAANDATHSAVGLRIVGGTATNQADNATHSASGTVQGTITGTASHQATRATHNAIGLRLISGTASHQAQTATQTASDIPLVQIPLGLRQTSDITPVRGILNTTPSYGILKLG